MKFTAGIKYCGWADAWLQHDYLDDRTCSPSNQDDRLAGCSLDDCPDLAACVVHCDACPSCTAVHFKPDGGGTMRCHLLENTVWASFQDTPYYQLNGYGIYVNERAEGCNPGPAVGQTTEV